jgi:hypothetical protein
MTDAAPAPLLTPVQERTLALLRREPDPVEFDRDFVTDLVARMREATDEYSEALGGAKVFVSKAWVTRALGCETHFLAPDEFRFTPITARGFVAHKAIELGFHWRGEPNPADLVDEALARLADEASYRGGYVGGLTDGDLAQLRSFAVERVTAFLHDFPPLPRNADPVLEASMKWSNGTFDLSGKADLVVGRPTGRESRRLIVDFKSGGRSANHRQDLRFYALVETLRSEVPPRKLVTYYLDWSEAEAEPVTEGILESALDRTLGAIERYVDLTLGNRPPTKTPGPSCRWCPHASTCDEGKAHLTAMSDDGTQGFDDPA